MQVICTMTIFDFLFAPISALKHALFNLQQSLGVRQKDILTISVYVIITRTHSSCCGSEAHPKAGNVLLVLQQFSCEVM